MYLWDDGQVVKLFHAGTPRAHVAQEARLTALVHEAGVAAPAAGDVVEARGRYGFVMERLRGPSMLSVLPRQPWRIISLAQTLAQLQASFHARSVAGLPSQRGAVRASIDAAGAIGLDDRSVAPRVLDRLPDGDALCHGDLHPDNVIMSPEGPVVIDWIGATSGNPMADVARTRLLLTVGALPADQPVVTRLLALVARGLFQRAYLRRYFRLRPGGRRELDAWALPSAAARLRDQVPEEQARLVAMVEAYAAQAG